MRDHGVEDYAELRDMDATDVGVRSDDDHACLDELGQYLAAADAWQRFGVWLLHKPFVERAMRAPRKTQTTPSGARRFPNSG
jgi:hypothetical protein